MRSVSAMLSSPAEGLNYSVRSGQGISAKRVHPVMTTDDDLWSIIDTIPALAWSAHPDGSAEFFNRSWLAYTGLSIEEALANAPDSDREAGLFRVPRVIGG